MDTTGNFKDSMKSTWRTGPRDQWNIHHWALDVLNVYPVELNKEVPIHSKEEKIPYLSEWSIHRWILFYAALPLLLHQLYGAYSGNYLGPIATFWLYFIAFNAVIIKEVKAFRRLSHIYGFLDGDKHERDGVPDVGVGKVVRSLYKTTGSRLMLAIWLTYQPGELPTDMRWEWLFLEIGVLWCCA